MASIAQILQKAIDAESMTHQVLQSAVTGAKARKGGVTEVSFMTDAITPNNLLRNDGPVGLIIWVPRDWLEGENQ